MLLCPPESAPIVTHLVAHHRAYNAPRAGPSSDRLTMVQVCFYAARRARTRCGSAALAG